MTSILDVLEAGWLILFFISIIFIFFIIFRELGDQTRGMKTWKRIPYGKMLPRFSLTYQHFNRKGELLTNTSYNICRSIRKDMLDYMAATKGFNTKEIESFVGSKEALKEIFQNNLVVEFLYDPSTWLKLIQPPPTLFSKLFRPIKELFGESEIESDLFIVELLSVMNEFTRVIDAS